MVHCVKQKKMSRRNTKRPKIREVSLMDGLSSLGWKNCETGEFLQREEVTGSCSNDSRNDELAYV